MFFTSSLCTIDSYEYHETLLEKGWIYSSYIKHQGYGISFPLLQHAHWNKCRGAGLGFPHLWGRRNPFRQIPISRSCAGSCWSSSSEAAGGRGTRMWQMSLLFDKWNFDLCYLKCSGEPCQPQRWVRNDDTQWVLRVIFVMWCTARRDPSSGVCIENCNCDWAVVFRENLRRIFVCSLLPHCFSKEPSHNWWSICI